MRYRQPIAKRCRRHGVGTNTTFCYYCYRSALINKLTNVLPEERLLQSIFGGSRYYSPINPRKPKRRLESARRLLTL